MTIDSKPEPELVFPDYIEKLAIKNLEDDLRKKNCRMYITKTRNKKGNKRVYVITPDRIPLPGPEILPEPIESYKRLNRAFNQFWKAMTGLQSVPRDSQDNWEIYDLIKSTHDQRLTLFKGLDKARAVHLHNMLVWMEILIERTLQEWNHIQADIERGGAPK
ncbi:MAG: hypothetical protein WA941_14810 [Nitrososphaeraceae archaeon]